MQLEPDSSRSSKGGAGVVLYIRGTTVPILLLLSIRLCCPMET